MSKVTIAFILLFAVAISIVPLNLYIFDKDKGYSKDIYVIGVCESITEATFLNSAKVTLTTSNQTYNVTSDALYDCKESLKSSQPIYIYPKNLNRNFLSIPLAVIIVIIDYVLISLFITMIYIAIRLRNRKD